MVSRTPRSQEATVCQSAITRLRVRRTLKARLKVCKPHTDWGIKKKKVPNIYNSSSFFESKHSTFIRTNRLCRKIARMWNGAQFACSGKLQRCSFCLVTLSFHRSSLFTDKLLCEAGTWCHHRNVYLTKCHGQIDCYLYYYYRCVVVTASSLHSFSFFVTHSAHHRHHIRLRDLVQCLQFIGRPSARV